MPGDDDVASAFRRTDELIDREARALTRGEPSSRLRQVVRARIEQRPRTWALPMWVPALAGAAALAITATIVGQIWFGSPDSSPVVPAASVASAPAVPLAVTKPPEPQPVERVEHRERPGPRRPVKEIEIDPLVIEPLEVLRLTATDTSSGVMPIEIDDLRIEPLQIE
jgi:hypothetical protein